ncbi:MAG: YHS domain-containing protein [Pirellulaceae bacterium]
MAHMHKTLPGKTLPSNGFVTDPVCGMTIDPADAAGSENYHGTTFHFCSSHCETKFRKNPEQFAKEPDTHDVSDAKHTEQGYSDQPHKHVDVPNKAEIASGTTIYTCPMHPEIEQDHPGDCPICGMSLEPKTATAVDEDNSELIDMTRRLWIGGLLTLPVFVLAMLHLFPIATLQTIGDSHLSRWIQFALTTPVVFWAAAPFFRRGWRSLVSRNLNMFTLISIGVGAAYVFSVIALFVPTLFPHAMQHGGDSVPAAKLVPETTGLARGDGLQAKVTMRDPKEGSRVVSFQLQQDDQQPVHDLEPYLGAMGHLVVVSAIGKDYVHAHPLTESSADGKVEFEVHFPRLGIYKLWGQFQRSGRVYTLPIVLDIGENPKVNQ